jgi:hypothetical protein
VIYTGKKIVVQESVKDRNKVPIQVVIYIVRLRGCLNALELIVSA